MNKEKDGLVLFDFDGTLTTQDTFLLFLKFVCPGIRFWANTFKAIPFLFLWKLKLKDPGWVKAKILYLFLPNIPLDKFTQLSEDFAKNVIPRYINPKALNTLEFHIQKGHTAVLVSASPESWTKPWAKSMGMHCIATRLAFNSDIYTGKIKGINCNGKEKVNRILEEFNPNNFKIIYAYGNSKGDLPMLKMAHKAFYRTFPTYLIKSENE
jgi:phosphatidylglycerophosphatase C